MTPALAALIRTERNVIREHNDVLSNLATDASEPEILACSVAIATALAEMTDALLKAELSAREKFGRLPGG